jgi:PAS domain S-box-containing protein
MNRSYSSESFSGQFSIEQRVVVDALPDGLLLTDASGNIYDCNLVFCEMLGYDRAELIGLHVTKCVDSGDLKARPPKEREFLRDRVIRSKRLFRRKDGTTFWGDLHARRVNDKYSLTVVRQIDNADPASEKKRVINKTLPRETRRKAKRLVSTANE